MFYVCSVQIMAYRLLARNQPLSQQLALAVQGVFLNIFSYDFLYSG